MYVTSWLLVTVTLNGIVVYSDIVPDAGLYDMMQTDIAQYQPRRFL